MQYDGVEINRDPAVGCGTDHFAFHRVYLGHSVICGTDKASQHPVAGAGANDEIVRKNCHPLQIDQNNIFSFFIFKCVNQFTRNLNSVFFFQSSPRRFNLKSNFNIVAF